MDNTSSDNKNKMTIVFGQMLVASGLCGEVNFNFLPVGHTHEDIDQAFSVIAFRLRGNTAHTYGELVTQTRLAFKSDRPCYSQLLRNADVFDWAR